MPETTAEKQRLLSLKLFLFDIELLMISQQQFNIHQIVYILKSIKARLNSSIEEEKEMIQEIRGLISKRSISMRKLTYLLAILDSYVLRKTKQTTTKTSEAFEIAVTITTQTDPTLPTSGLHQTASVPTVTTTTTPETFETPLSPTEMPTPTVTTQADLVTTTPESHQTSSTVTTTLESFETQSTVPTQTDLALTTHELHPTNLQVVLKEDPNWVPMMLVELSRISLGLHMKYTHLLQEEHFENRDEYIMYTIMVLLSANIFQSIGQSILLIERFRAEKEQSYILDFVLVSRTLSKLLAFEKLITNGPVPEISYFIYELIKNPLNEQIIENTLLLLDQRFMYVTPTTKLVDFFPRRITFCLSPHFYSHIDSYVSDTNAMPVVPFHRKSHISLFGHLIGLANQTIYKPIEYLPKKDQTKEDQIALIISLRPL